MKRIHSIGMAMFFAASCTHDLNRNNPPNVGAGNQGARAKLGGADFSGARDDYGSVLNIDASNSEAAVGWVIADLLTLPRSQPVADFLTRMNQPSFNLEQDLFGPAGYLADVRRSYQGTANVQVISSAQDVSFPTLGVKARIYSPTFFVSLRQRSGDQTRTISLEVNLTDSTKRGPSDPMVPLTSGTTIEVSKMNGSVSVYEPADTGGSVSVSGCGGPGCPTPPQPTGTITFTRVPAQVGDAYAFTFNGVSPPSSMYAVSGDVSGTIPIDPKFDDKKLPFGTEFQAGSFGQGVINAIMRASAFDTAFLSGQLKAFGDLLAADADRLALVTGSAQADAFSYVVPAALFSTPEDLHLNITDVRVIRAALDFAAAGCELSAQYRYLEGSVVDLIGPNGGSSSQVFVAGRVQPNLAMNFLARAAGFDLSVFKARLQAGLDSAYDALTKTPGGQGMLDFTTAPSRRQFQDIAALVDSVRTSIGSDQPVTIPSEPLFQVWLKSYFDQPLDRDRLLMLSGLTELVRLVQSSPDYLEVETEPFTRNPDHNLGGVVHFPPNRNMHCASVNDCGGAGYVCDGASTCQPDVPYMFSGTAAMNAMVNDWPAFLDPSLRDIFELDLF